MVNKIIGYIVAGIGLLGMFISTDIIKNSLPFLSVIPGYFILYPSMVITGLGIVILVATSGPSGKKEKQYKKEVPIYQGKKIVGYRRD